MSLERYLNKNPNWLLTPFSSMVKDFDSYFTQNSPTRVWEDEKSNYFEVDIPGFKKSDIKIDMSHRAMTISASVENRYGEETRTRSARYCYEFPSNSDMEVVEAKLENGVLSVKTGKSLTPVPRPVKILE